MKLKNFLLLGLLSIFLCNCGTMNVYVKPGTSFSRNSTITILEKGQDKVGVRGEITHLLVAKGFNIVSEKTAKQAIKYKDQIKGKDFVNNEISAEIYKIKEFNSIYALDIDGTYYWDMFYYALRNLNAQLIDLNSGEVVMTCNFRGDRSVSSVLKELADKISAQITK